MTTCSEASTPTTIASNGLAGRGLELLDCIGKNSNRHQPAAYKGPGTGPDRWNPYPKGYELPPNSDTDELLSILLLAYAEDMDVITHWPGGPVPDKPQYQVTRYYWKDVQLATLYADGVLILWMNDIHKLFTNQLKGRLR